jgi:hypothetical protein
MQITLREKFFWWLCDYWWFLVSLVVFVLIAYLTRVSWLPLIGIENAPVAIAVPESSSSSQFTDPRREYSFSHPASWPVQDLGNQSQQWTLPNGVVMSVHSEPVVSSDTLESYAQEVVTRLPYDVLEQSNAQVGGQPAIRQEVGLPGQTLPTAVGYLVIYKGKKYQIALAGLDCLSSKDQTSVIKGFEGVLATFKFPN